MRAFFAKKDTITPTIIGICSLLIYLALALILMGPIPSSQDWLISCIGTLQASLASLTPSVTPQAHVGLALASSIVALFSLAMAITLYTLKIGHFPWRPFLTSLLRGVVGTLAMVVAVKLSTPLDTHPFIACVTGVGVGVLSYVLTLFILGSQEMRETVSLIRRKMTR